MSGQSFAAEPFDRLALRDDDGAERVIEFMSRTFGAEVLVKLPRDDGSVMHASVPIGDSVVMIADGSEDSPPLPAWPHVYVADVDDAYRRGGVRDAAGNAWWIATHVGR
jgi:PhnB protein